MNFLVLRVVLCACLHSASSSSIRQLTHPPTHPPANLSINFIHLYYLPHTHTYTFQARRALVKPLLGLFAGEPNGKAFRNRLDQLLLVQRKSVDMDLR